MIDCICLVICVGDYINNLFSYLFVNDLLNVLFNVYLFNVYCCDCIIEFGGIVWWGVLYLSLVIVPCVVFVCEVLCVKGCTSMMCVWRFCV